jgi:putative chitinase
MINTKILEQVKLYIQEYELTTPERLAMFMAQTSYETLNYTRLKENLNYSACGLLTTFKNKFTAQEATEYAHNPIKIANRVYANNYGNSNEQSGDGAKYLGRGFVQLTFKDNYIGYSKFAKIDCVNNPDMLLNMPYALGSALWYWREHDLANTLIPKQATIQINGGLNGYTDRGALYNEYLQYLTTNKVV